MADTDLVTLEEIKGYLGIPASDASQDVALASWIEAATSAIEAYCERAFVIREFTDEYPPMAPAQRGRLYLRRYPLVELLQVQSMDTGDDVDVALITQRKRLGILERLPWRWTEVRYTAGLCADTDHVPQDVKRACGLYVSISRGRAAAGSAGGMVGPIAGRTMGQVSTSYHAPVTVTANPAIAGSPTDMPDVVAHLLAPYMSRAL